MKKNVKLVKYALMGMLSFGLVATTFTSCKDYDDDIDNLQQQINTVVKDLGDLKTQIGDKGVSSVTFDEKTNVLTVVDGTGSHTYNIQTSAESVGIKEVVMDGKDLKVDGKVIGQVGDKVEVKEGELTVNGEPTGIKVGKYSVLIKKDTNKVTIRIPDEKGELQEVELALYNEASAISEIEIVEENDFSNNVNFNYWLAGKTTKWEGPKGNIADKTILYGSESSLLVRIAPASVDATQLSFELVNSKNNVAPLTLAAPKAYKDLLTRAASENGLYVISLNPQPVISSENDFTKNFKVDNQNVLFALRPVEGNFLSNFDIELGGTKKEDADLGAILVNEDEAATAVTINGTTSVISGVENFVTFENPANLYDSYLSVSNDAKDLFGIEFGEDLMSFKVTKNPDALTAASFDLIVNSLSNLGTDNNIKKTTIKVTVNPSLGETTYDVVNHIIKKDAAKNYFTVSLDNVKTTLGTNLSAWNTTVDLQNVSVAIKVKNDKGELVATSGNNLVSDNALSVVTIKEIADNDDKNTTVASEAKYLKFKVNNDATNLLKVGTTYYAVVTFKKAGDSAPVLNTAIVPFTVSIPALSTIFIEQDGVFVDGIANAYMVGTAEENNIAPSYAFTSAFNALKAKIEAAGLTFSMALDGKTKVAGDKTSADLAAITNGDAISSANIGNVKITLTGDATDAKTNTPAGYKKDLVVNVYGAKYIGKYTYGSKDGDSEADYTFKIRLMSPLLEGKIAAIKDAVEVPATSVDGFNIDGSMISGYTYNNIAYSIFADKYVDATSVNWKRPEVKNVKFKTEDPNIFAFSEANAATLTEEAEGTAATKDSKGNVINGHVTVYPRNLATTASADMTITLTDAWGYILTQKVKVTVVKE